MLKTRIKNIRAFTVVELLVATLILSLFLGGVFSLYRIGSNMYAAGSWKYSRQKDAEIFLNYFKERVEQASCVSWGNKKSTGAIEVSTIDTRFVCLRNKTNISRCTERKWLAEFVVAKPDLSAYDKSKLGLILYHSLVLVPNKTTGLCDLVMTASKNFDDTGFFKPTDSFPPTGFSLAQFTKGNPRDYGFPPGNTHSFTLRDIASITVSCGKSSARYKNYEKNVFETEESPLFGLYIQFRNPKHSKTTLTLSRKAKIDKSVKLEEKSAL